MHSCHCRRPFLPLLGAVLVTTLSIWLHQIRLLTFLRFKVYALCAPYVHFSSHFWCNSFYTDMCRFKGTILLAFLTLLPPFSPPGLYLLPSLCVCFDFASASSNLPQESVQPSFLTSLPPRCNLPSIRPLSTQWLELFPRLHFPTVSQKNIYTFMNPFIQRLWTNCIAQCHSMTRIGPLGAHQRPR